MTRPQLLILALVLVASVGVRICSLPPKPFFCDVPDSVAAIQNGKMVIQFPGYAIFHLAARTLGSLLGGPFPGLVAFSLLCGTGAVVYCMMFAHDRAGFSGALLAGTLMGFSPIAIYFSCVGASYSTDLLGTSAVIYHGNRVLTRGSQGDYKWAVLWFAFGCLMRTLSFPFLALGILYLLKSLPVRKPLAFTACIAALAIAVYVAVTIHYSHNLKSIWASTKSVQNVGFHGISLIWMVANEVRNVLFILAGLNLFAFVIPAFLWIERRRLNTKLGRFFAALALPYACFLLWYDCHAGYVCLLLPVLICAPWLVEKSAWLEARTSLFAASFLCLGLLQFFVARPLAFQGTLSLTLNSYFLTYTRAGIEEGMFKNLKHWAAQYHLEKDNPATDSPY